MSKLKRHYTKQFTIAAMDIDKPRSANGQVIVEIQGALKPVGDGPFFDGDYYGFVHKGIIHGGYRKAIYRDKAYERKIKNLI